VSLISVAFHNPKVPFQFAVEPFHVLTKSIPIALWLPFLQSRYYFVFDGNIP
jgi:hypothetical protein